MFRTARSLSVAITLLGASGLLSGCGTLTESKGTAGGRQLVGSFAQPLCLFWCHITSTVTDGEAGSTVKGATVSTTETTSVQTNVDKKQ